MVFFVCCFECVTGEVGFVTGGFEVLCTLGCVGVLLTLSACGVLYLMCLHKLSKLSCCVLLFGSLFAEY